MSILEIIIALIIVALLGRYITYVLSFFVFLPSEFTLLLLFSIALVIVLFVIHRKE